MKRVRGFESRSLLLVLFAARAVLGCACLAAVRTLASSRVSVRGGSSDGENAGLSSRRSRVRVPSAPLYSIRGGVTCSTPVSGSGNPGSNPGLGACQQPAGRPAGCSWFHADEAHLDERRCATPEAAGSRPAVRFTLKINRRNAVAVVDQTREPGDDGVAPENGDRRQ